jgi:mevalonate kinase
VHRSSAPGAAFLLGEHAVVYDQPSLLFAVDRRATATVEAAPEDDLPHSEYVYEAVERARDHAGESTPVSVDIESEIPLGAGLGSSAAVTVATLHATTHELGTPMGRERIAEEAHAVELDVQGAASPADTYTTTTGGFTSVGDGARSVEAPETEFVVGYDGGSAPTGEMVAGVAELVDTNPVAEDLIEAVGDLARRGATLVEEGEFGALGELMDMNQGLLDALGVSSSSLSRMVWAARDAGGTAKLTGAGGAGCVVAHPATEEVRGAVADVAEEAYVVEVAEGVRSE